MSVVTVDTLDTKGKEVGFVRDALEEQGVEVHFIDVGASGEPEIEPDTGATAVVEAGGSILETFREVGDHDKATEIIGDGAAVVVSRLHSEGRLDGIPGLGSRGNTSATTTAMRALPIGVPKLMLLMMTSGDTEPYIGYHDTATIYSVADIEGLDQFSRIIISNAALAIVGMVSNEPDVKTEEKPIIGITMLGVITPCAQRVRDWLEAHGYEIIVFHVAGTGGRVMEPLIEEGVVDDAPDVTTIEWADELVGGVLVAGPGRSDAAAERGISQVVSTGAFDMVNFGLKGSISSGLDGRQSHVHNPQVTLMRTTSEENTELSRIIAEKLNAATGPITPAPPLGGVSMLDTEGEAFYDLEADDALFDALREHLDGDVEPIQLSVNINDDEFAFTPAEAIDRRMRAAV